MHIWTITKWKKYYSETSNIRRGLRLRFDKDVRLEVKNSIKKFCKWLRKEYFFPIRITIYVKKSERIKALDGDMVCGTFFGPFDKKLEPYIKIATGDFHILLNKMSRDNAIASILICIAHELTHYFQWINDLKLTEIGKERQATNYSNFILDEYKEICEHP